MERSRVAIVVPALNEERSIASVVASVASYGLPVVVSDGSTDGTAEAAAAAGAVVVRHEQNQGYDAAISSGFGRAAELGAEFVVTFDADGQHDPSLIPEFTRLLANGRWLVLGVRPAPARISEWAFAAYTRLAYGIHDPLCGMKGYSMSAYKDLRHFDCYRSIGTELMLHCARAGRPMAEVKIPIAPRQGAPRLGGAWRSNARIFRSLMLALLRSRRRDR
jgi:glycosyltransferase involved in cell wall biosynthesis